MSTPLADYDAERQAFESLLNPQCGRRILMFRGTSGSGKTTLLSYCRERATGTIPHIPIQLRGNAVSIAEIFYRSGGYLGWDSLSNFTGQVADLQDAPKVQIDRNWLAGINNRISIALHAEDQMGREHRRVALTEAWFEDMKASSKPILFMLDTFEQGTTEVRDWISGPFLARAAQIDQVRILVAGQDVPDENNIEWGSCCITRELYGVRDAIHWLPVIEAMNRHIPIEESFGWLAGVCHALDGRPKDIMQVIENLPRRSPSS